jgi:hypothetical protein
VTPAEVSARLAKLRALVELSFTELVQRRLDELRALDDLTRYLQRRS